MDPTTTFVPKLPRRARQLLVVICAIAWLSFTAREFNSLKAYESTAGAQHPAPTVSHATDGRWTLHLFLHPKCPCSRASVAELARIAARCGPTVQTHVHFVLPDGAGPDWRTTPLFDAASAIPNVNVTTDPLGAEAARHGAATSGHAVLFSPDGSLAFAGGITAGRGHEGENAGADAIHSLVRHGTSPTRTTPVFGCSLGVSREDQNPDPSKGTNRP